MEQFEALLERAKFGDRLLEAGLSLRCGNLPALEDDVEGALALAVEMAGFELALLDRCIGEAEACPEGLEVPPLLAADPARAEATHTAALEACVARERLARLEAVVRHLGGLTAWAPLAPRLAALDERLRPLLLRGRFLWAARSRQAARLPHQLERASWWFSLPPVDEAEEEGDEEAQSEAVKALGDWAGARTDWSGGAPVLRLEATEARALLGTSEGRALSEYLGELLDVSAAEPTGEELWAAVQAYRRQH